MLFGKKISWIGFFEVSTHSVPLFNDSAVQCDEVHTKLFQLTVLEKVRSQYICTYTFVTSIYFFMKLPYMFIQN